MNTKEKLIDNMCIDNVKDIQISKETRSDFSGICGTKTEQKRLN